MYLKWEGMLGTNEVNIGKFRIEQGTSISNFSVLFPQYWVIDWNPPVSLDTRSDLIRDTVRVVTGNERRFVTGERLRGLKVVKVPSWYVNSEEGLMTIV